MAHKFEHGKDSDVCVRCAEESHADNAAIKKMKIKCPSCKKEIVQVSHSPGVVESGAEVECGACGNIWTPFPARGGGAKTADLGRRPGRPLNDSVAATGHIQMRVVMVRKNWYVRMARLHNLTLAVWMQRVCDEESGYPPKSQLVTANC